MIEYGDGITISQLINELERIKQEHGDIAVYTLLSDTFSTCPVTQIQVCPAGVGITIVDRWGPMEDHDEDEPLRVVIN